MKNWEKWEMVNRLLNMARKEKGLPLVSPMNNPHYKK